MEVREIVFSAGLNSVSPSTVQSAGVAGDKNATRVTFLLSPEFVNSDYTGYFDFGDGAGEFFTSERFPVTTNEVSFVLPEEWTESPGIAVIRFVASKSVNGEEVLRIQTLAGKIAFKQKG